MRTLKIDQVNKGEGVVVLTLTGSADIHSEGQLQAGLTHAAVTRPKLVVLDLLGVDILASVAIGVLVGFRTKVMNGGGRVVVVGVPDQVAKTMRFTRVSELFPRFASVEAAIAAGAGATA